MNSFSEFIKKLFVWILFSVIGWLIIANILLFIINLEFF